MAVYYTGNSLNSDYLKHHGILGMKWGIRRYQNPDGSLTAEGRERRGIGKNGNPRHTPSSARKVANQRAKSLEAARAAKAAKAQYEKDKAEALKSGNATAVMRFKGDLTAQQLQDAINRIRNEQTLAELMAKEMPKIKTGKDHVNDIIGFFDTVNRVVGKIADYASTMDKVKKQFGSESDAKEKARAKKIKDIIKRGDPIEILNHLEEMTSAEVKDAQSRLQNISKIRNYSTDPKANNSIEDAIEEYLDRRG